MSMCNKCFHIFHALLFVSKQFSRCVHACARAQVRSNSEQSYCQRFIFQPNVVLGIPWDPACLSDGAWRFDGVNQHFLMCRPRSPGTPCDPIKHTISGHHGLSQSPGGPLRLHMCTRRTLRDPFQSSRAWKFENCSTWCYWCGVSQLRDKRYIARDYQ